MGLQLPNGAAAARYELKRRGLGSGPYDRSSRQVSLDVTPLPVSRIPLMRYPERDVCFDRLGLFRRLLGGRILGGSFIEELRAAGSTATARVTVAFTLAFRFGLRIDHILMSPPALEACLGVEVDRDARGGQKPSDHAPVIATLEAAGS